VNKAPSDDNASVLAYCYFKYLIKSN